MAYPEAEDAFADAGAKRELAQALYARVQPIGGTPAEQYLIKARKIPAEAVAACSDLGYLPSPIEGRGPTDHALVSLLRDAAGEVCGLQLEFVDVLGARTGTEPGKQTYALRERGVRDGLFCAGGAGDVVHLTEGYSAKALALASLGLKTYGGGAMSVLGFALPPERTVVLVPDRAPAPDQWTADGKERLLDQHEAAYARAIDRLLLAKPQHTVLVASAPDCTAHAACKDADGYLRQHGEIRLRDLIGRTMPGALSREGEIKRLTAIENELDRAAAIKAAWKDKPVLHGIPIALLREHVEAERAKGHAATAAKRDGPEPWDEPVQLGSVLNELVTEIRRYIATSAANAHTAAVWCAMTHIYDRLHCAPKLALQSPTPGCGKTTFLDCLSNVVCRPEPVSGVGAGAFVRLSDEIRPTWLLDEADRLLNPKNTHEGLTAAINAQSYRRLARMQISVPTPDGGWRVRAFEFWCPMLLAGIKRLVDTVQDRSIILKMSRARPGELRHRLIEGTSPQLQQIQRKFVRWAQDLAGLDPDPAVPKFLHNREADLWRPLFALAAEAGGRWPARIEQAAWDIHGQRTEDADRLIELLVAIFECFEESGEQQLATADLVTRLINRSDEPWATIKRGQPLDAYYLRNMLSGVVRRQKPKQRIGKGFWRGYLRSDFAEAWARYLPSDPVSASATSATPPHTPGKPQKQPGPGEADRERASATVRPEADRGISQDPRGASVADDPVDPPPSQPPDIPAKIGAVADVAHVADQETRVLDESGAAEPDRAEPSTDALACATCGVAFDHPAGRRGRRPSKCPTCRGNSAGDHAATQEVDPRQIDIEEVIAVAGPKPAVAPEFERVTDDARAGLRCAYCTMPFTYLDGEPAEIDGKPYHADLCADTIRRRLAAEARL